MVGAAAGGALEDGVLWEGVSGGKRPEEGEGDMCLRVREERECERGNLRARWTAVLLLALLPLVRALHLIRYFPSCLQIVLSPPS